MCMYKSIAIGFCIYFTFTYFYFYADFKFGVWTLCDTLDDN